MRIFMAGDHVSGTGPANVTEYYIKNLPEGTLYQKRRNRILRVPEIFINTLRADVVVYSGYSKQNIIGLKLAAFFKRPSAYLMHGCVEFENGINLEPDEEMNRVERKTLELADLILAVSESFCAWLKDYYPMHADKIGFVTNGIDRALADRATDREKTDCHMILSIGGGMPRKKIRHICEAVELLRREYDRDLYLCVIGDKGADSEKIDSYDFVDNKGIVSFEEGTGLFGRAALFVQNSCFETFGLAVVEAISCGCPVLCSRHVGALGLFNGIRDEAVIVNYDDPEEIAKKIRYLLNDPDAGRLSDKIEWERVSWKVRSRELISQLSKLVCQP